MSARGKALRYWRAGQACKEQLNVRAEAWVNGVGKAAYLSFDLPIFRLLKH